MKTNAARANFIHFLSVNRCLAPLFLLAEGVAAAIIFAKSEINSDFAPFFQF
jgi:hypothetical protein